MKESIRKKVSKKASMISNAKPIIEMPHLKEYKDVFIGHPSSPIEILYNPNDTKQQQRLEQWQLFYIFAVGIVVGLGIEQMICKNRNINIYG